MAYERQPPKDFGARVRAARGYMRVSQAELARQLGISGASSSTIKGWENGGMPAPLVLESLVPRLATASGLPERFFWGDGEEPDPIEQRLREIETTVKQLALDAAARDMEAHAQLDEVAQAIHRLQPPPRS